MAAPVPRESYFRQILHPNWRFPNRKKRPLHCLGCCRQVFRLVTVFVKGDKIPVERQVPSKGCRWKICLVFFFEDSRRPKNVMFAQQNGLARATD